MNWIDVYKLSIKVYVNEVFELCYNKLLVEHGF